MDSADITVAAIVPRRGRYLIVEETAGGRIVLSQPGGHIETAETPKEALVREVLEETGCTVSARELIGVYRWVNPQSHRHYLRLVYAAEFLACDESLPLDVGIVARHWMTGEELQTAASRLRFPIVARCIRDFEAGRRQSARSLAGLLPLQNNVERVLADAQLV